MHREAMGEMFAEMSYGEQVFQNKLFTGAEELFASARCVSRIIEMQSPQYKENPHRPESATVGLEEAMLDLGEVGDMVSGLKLPPYSFEVDNLGRKIPAGAEVVDERPRFSDKHFFGAGKLLNVCICLESIFKSSHSTGWWERLREKVSQR